MAAIKWTGAAGDNNFNNPANWSPAQVPGPSDTVTINENTATLINISQADALQALTTSTKVTLSINDNASLTVGNATTKNAALTNAGVITVNANDYTTALIVGGPEVTLSGGGTIAMNGNGADQITAVSATDELNNTGNTILGGGALGAGTLTFVNGAAGIVDADSGTQLIINTGTIAVSNAGLLEATGNGAGLLLQSTINDGTTGQIAAMGGTVYLESGASIEGGTLSSTGSFAIVDANTGTLDGTANAVTNTGTVDIQDGSTLTLLGGIVNKGQIQLNNNDYNTDLIIGPATGKAGTVTLTGSGTIALGVGNPNRIYGGMAGDTLVNQNNVIAGAGQLGLGTLTLVNDGTIDATDGNSLVVNTGAVAIANNAVMESTSTGGLVLQTAVNGSGGGTILANGGNVYLNGGTLQGGTVQTKGGAALVISGGNTGTLDGTAQTVTNDGQITLNDGGTLSLLGTITNAGTISTNANDYVTSLVVSGASVSLTGGGVVQLGNSGANEIFGAAGTDTLVNVNNTIEGSGQFGAGTLTLTNDGTINATGGNALFMNLVALTNNALMEATSTGGLVLQTVVNDSGGGTIFANGGNVYLNGGTLIGGTVKSAGGAALNVSGSNTGTLNGTTQTVTNSGQIVVNDNGTLSLLGTITNAGTISFYANDYYTDFIVTSPTVTLVGGGTIALDNAGGNRIYGAVATDVLVNTNNLIEGAGQFGAGQLTFTNASAGIVDANVSNQLVLNTGSTISNAGLLEATTGSGGLVIQSNVSNGTTGRITAAGANVFLASSADIVGGTLSSSGAGTILDSNNATLGAVSGKLTNTGTVALQDGTTLSLLGTIFNKGEITLNDNDYYTDLISGSGTTVTTVTLTGSGTISLDDASANRLYAAAAGDTLINLNNTIVGAGQIGVGSDGLILVNDATIDAVGGNRLTINTGATVTNNALLESSGTGGLYLQGTISGSGGGTILAATGNVYLSGATLQGGILSTHAGEAVIDINNNTLDGSKQTVTNSGLVSLNDGTTLTLLGTITNTGTIALNANDYNTDLIAGGATVTLTGGGTILLNNDGANRIYGAIGSDVLVNANNIIEGAGQLGTGQLTLVNQAAGIIDADDSNGLYLTGGGTAVTNAGLIESTGSGGLVIETVVNSSTGGTILANGGNVYFNGGTIQGGLLATGANGGVFNVYGGATFDGSASAVTNASVITLNDGETITLLGSFINKGSIDLNGNDYNTDLVVGSAGATLSGSGTILLNNDTGDRIYGATGTDTLVNVNNVIQGSGQIGAGQLTLINEAAGIIDADESNGLTLNGGSVAVVNAGLIEATAGGALFIQGSVDSSSGGTILANGANVYLYAGTLQGGLIQTEAGGALVVDGTGTLDGSTHTLTNAGVVSLGDGTTLSLLGTIANQGTITLSNNDYFTDLIFGSPTLTLTGTGTVSLNTSGSRFYGGTTASVLDNVSNTINGDGQLGAGQLTLINSGIIDGAGMVINLGSTGLNTATGELLGVGAGLTLQNGTYTNLGTIQADNGSSVTFSSNATLTNDNATGTLTGGTYAALDTGNDATLSITGTAVTTLDAILELSGIGAQIEFGGVTIDVSLDAISAGGTLDLLNDRDFTATANAGTFTDNGVITLGGGTFTSNSLTIGKTGGFLGFGVIDGPIINNGLITVEGGQLLLNGLITGTGSITTGTGGIIVLDGGGNLNQPVSGTGTLLLEGGTYTITKADVTIANVDVTSGAELSGTGTITGAVIDDGEIMATVGKLTLSGALSGDGTLAAAQGATLVESGGGTFTGLIEGPGKVHIQKAITLDAGTTLAAKHLNDTANITLGTGADVANTRGNTLSIGSAPSPDSRHRAQAVIINGTGTLANTGNIDALYNAQIAVAFDNTGTVAVEAGTLSLAAAVSGGGTYAVATGGLLDVLGGGDFAAALTGAGTVQFDSAFTLDKGASLAATTVIDTNVLTLATNESVTNLAGNLFQFQDAGGQEPHRAQVEVTGGNGSVFTNAGSVASTASAASFGLAFVNTGSVSASAGTLSFLGAATNNGAITATGAEIDFSTAVAGTGTLAIGAGGTLGLLAGAAAGQIADFQAGTGLLNLSHPLQFLGVIDGFAVGDQIDLVNTAETSYNFANGTLTVVNGKKTVASLQFGGSYSTGSFTLLSDNHGGTLITHS